MRETRSISRMSWPEPRWRNWYIMRRGARRMASTAASGPETGSRSAGSSPSGRGLAIRGGVAIAGGIGPAVGLSSFMSLLSNDDRVITFRDELRHRAMRDVNQRAGRFHNLEPAVPHRPHRFPRRAVRCDHYRVRSHPRKFSCDSDSPLIQIRQHCFIVNQVAKNRQRLAL